MSPSRKSSLLGAAFFIISLVAASSEAQASPADAATTATAAASAVGNLTFLSPGYSVAQSAGSISINVYRTKGSSGAATVTYADHNGTALSGAQFLGTTSVLKWSAGDQSAKTIKVAFAGAAFSGNKYFTIGLSNATGAAMGNLASTTVTIEGSLAAKSSAGAAAKLAAKLGKPAHLLVGIGDQSGSVNVVSAVLSEAAKVDIYSRYLGGGDWTSWDSPPCDYVCVVAAQADSLGAIPMYTQYQMANDGDGNLAGLNDAGFMKTYWARVKLMYQDIAAYGKPALVNLEPDFWGYVERAAPGSDPTKMTAIVKTNPDCAALPDNVTGVAGCLIAMARKYAPKAYVGFPPSGWGGDTDADVVAFMNAIGAQNADFIVEQTLDRDGGCMEVTPQPADCVRSGGPWYWDETNVTHPNFEDHLATVQAHHLGIGDLPVIWWQTPEGVPSSVHGGTAYHYRDNRMHYFLTHPSELTAVGGLAVVFGDGDGQQTNIASDGGQFQLLDSRYYASPAPLP